MHILTGWKCFNSAKRRSLTFLRFDFKKLKYTYRS